jgi:hypothetical protein
VREALPTGAAGSSSRARDTSLARIAALSVIFIVGTVVVLPVRR